MSMINFDNAYEKCTKSYEELEQEYFEDHKEELLFKIGDKVNISFGAEILDKDFMNFAKEKIFEVIGYRLGFDKYDPIYYKLNTGVQIQYCKAGMLIKTT